jgi:UMF1 family MFS transporter
MGPNDGYRDGAPQYEGEDTRLTSTKELRGWYSYGFAAEVFVICGMGK